MDKRAILIFFLLILSFVLIACQQEPERNKLNNQDAATSTGTDNYNDVREVAWNFVKEKGWNDKATENWQNAKITKQIADNNYELLDSSYKDKEVLLVSFEDKENVVAGTPPILIAPNTNKVIGYMLSE